MLIHIMGNSYISEFCLNKNIHIDTYNAVSVIRVFLFGMYVTAK